MISNFSEVLEKQLTNVVKTNKKTIILSDFNIDYSITDNRDFKLLSAGSKICFILVECNFPKAIFFIHMEALRALLVFYKE